MKDREKNSILYLGSLTLDQEKVLNSICQAIWNNESRCCGTGAHPHTIEILPLTEMKGSTPVFLLVGGVTHDFGNTNYRKVKESKDNCQVGVIITEGDSRDNYREDDNYPDLFILLEEKQIVIA